MRVLRASLVLAAVVVAPAVAGAQEEVVRLAVGETKAGVGTVRPICDAPSVAVIVNGVLRAIGPGETLCSAAMVQAQGTRRVYRVLVRPAAAQDPAGAKGGAGGRSER